MRYWFMGIPVVLISDVDDVKKVLSCVSTQEKGILYDNLKPWLGTGLLTSNGEKWKSMRKIITPTFHFSILREYIPIFSKNAKIMLSLVDKCGDPKSCELTGFVTYCALDSISETSMGREINSQVTKSENEYVRAIFRMGQIVVERLFSPFLYSDFVFRMTPLGREMFNVIRILHGVTSKLIEDRKKQQQQQRESSVSESNAPVNLEEPAKKQTPFLDLLIEKQKIFKFSDTELRHEVDTILMAGHDTTSTALNWCFFELGHHESIQNKVHDELQRIFEGSQRDPTHQDLMKMEYLKRVLQETLRLYPSAPVISRKFDVDIQLKNYNVPAKTEVILLLYHIHRNPDIFPQPEVFDPDRFLPEVVNKRNSFAYIPFSAGPRNCIGQKYAMMQMLVLSSYVLRKYKIKTLTPRESVRPVPDVILRPNVQFRWQLTPRL
ncbi:hypothetical protein RUM44_000915 [Polyplax serrata]|uniref:Cytochrome P450 n=1 Tax=Polyplax serrata TaxID=468196 RepID=A0ABR1B8Y8_POLSC